MQRQVVRFTRQELYEKMWSRPAIALAEEFGISGRGLGKICSRLTFPSLRAACPWSKPKAGRIDDGARRGLESRRCGRSSGCRYRKPDPKVTRTVGR